MSRFVIVCLCALLTACATELKNTAPVQGFIQQMVEKHQFDKAELNALFASVVIRDDVIQRITKPAEAMPWFRYRKIFMTEARIKQGVAFWRANRVALAAAEQQYGVPAEIIVAIIGVESMYGQRPGGFRIVDALATLAFDYPPRSTFFTTELENFLLLCRDEHLDPLQPTGSYAGAMGMPQFMPSSFRTYARDFDQDGRRDIWHNPGDVIFSVANYFAQHQWQTGEPIMFPVTAETDDYQQALGKDLKPDRTVADLETLKITIPDTLSRQTKVKLLAFEQEKGHYLVASLNNFYVITRYNHSPLYALAVFQLSQAISNQKISSPYE